MKYDIVDQTSDKRDTTPKEKQSKTSYKKKKLPTSAQGPLQIFKLK